MEYKKFNNYYIIRLNKGEEVLQCLKNVCKENNISLGIVSGIGASNSVEIGLFNTETKEYQTNIKTGMFEISSLIGNITQMNDEVYLHLHINFSDENTNVFGGHLVKCYISATAEIVITEIDGTVDREFNEEIGLNLLNF